jgi:hypothetical protein
MKDNFGKTAHTGTIDRVLLFPQNLITNPCPEPTEPSHHPNTLHLQDLFSY